MAGVGFFFKGRILSDNDDVFLDDIGEGSNALYCLTNRTQCCSTEAGANRGLWRNSDGGNVRNNTVAIYSTRGFSSLLLNRRSSESVPTGVYTCMIPDAQNDLRMLNITINEGGEYYKHSSDCLSMCQLSLFFFNSIKIDFFKMFRPAMVGILGLYKNLDKTQHVRACAHLIDCLKNDIQQSLTSILMSLLSCTKTFSRDNRIDCWVSLLRQSTR